jgi:hypothetical protein
MKRRKFVFWIGLAPLVAAVRPLRPVQRIACIRWADGAISKRSFIGRNIEEAQSKAVAWLGPILTFREFDEVMICNPGMDCIWPGEVC